MLNLKKKYLGYLALISIMIQFCSTVYASDNDADNQDIVMLTRENVVSMAINHNGSVRTMNSTLEKLKQNYSDMIDATNMLKKLYSYLPRYNKLCLKYQDTISDSNYYRYFELQLKMTAGPLTDDELAELSHLNDILSSDDKARIITVPEYYEYKMLAIQFSNMGIPSDISKKQEYEMFTYPIYVAPVSLNANIQSLEIGIRTAKEGVAVGVRQVYSALVSLYSYYELQKQSYDNKVNVWQNTNQKYKLGIVSKIEADKAMIDMKISELQKNKMSRNINNLEMTLKQMLGIDLEKEIKLDDTYSFGYLDEFNTYLNKALKTRNEIQNAQISLEDAKNEFYYTRLHFAYKTDEYKIAEENVDKKQIEIDSLLVTIEKEIRNAYTDVTNKKMDEEVKKEEYTAAKEKLNDMKKYYLLGFISKDNLDSYNLLVLQKNIAYIDAQNNYSDALASLKSASSIGPNYNEGGADNAQ